MPLFFVNFDIFSTLLIASISSVGKTSLTELRRTRRSDLDLRKDTKREGEGGRGYKTRVTGLEKEGMQSLKKLK